MLINNTTNTRLCEYYDAKRGNVLVQTKACWRRV